MDPQRTLRSLTLPLLHQVVPSTFEENLPQALFSPAEYARATASAKALDVVAHLAAPVDLVIGADTVVDVSGRVLEKPADAADAEAMLSLLSGRDHLVHTGVALVLPPTAPGGEPRLHSFVASTCVEFCALSAPTIQAYVASGECFGKAGGYGIQGSAACFVRQVQGCYFNVVGLPLHQFTAALAELIASGELDLL